MDDLSVLITGDEPGLILITEIPPKRSTNSLSTARLSIHGYQAFFSFDPDSHQSPQTIHGVGIYSMFQTNYLYLKLLLIHHEHIWISVKLVSHDSLLVGFVY